MRGDGRDKFLSEAAKDAVKVKDVCVSEKERERVAACCKRKIIFLQGEI